ncbi:hypothetical protein GCM10010439_09100 [Actinocorallia aurantiaca]|uniref:Uncharacterized protein n=1 Tax=Actinocorallia aurantiaca TaxID=46204 RepID=A0ABN3TZJ5_9ACTN
MNGGRPPPEDPDGYGEEAGWNGEGARGEERSGGRADRSWRGGATGRARPRPRAVRTGKGGLEGPEEAK